MKGDNRKQNPPTLIDCHKLDSVNLNQNHGPINKNEPHIKRGKQHE